MFSNLDVDYLSFVARDPRAPIRKALATQLAVFSISPETCKGDVEAVVPIMMRLADDAVASVRAALAGPLTASAAAPREVLFALIGDLEEISLPLLLNGRAFSQRDLAAIVRHTDAVRQEMIALRSDIGPALCTTICEHGGREACASLLENRHVRPDPLDLERLAERFADDQAIGAQLLLQPGLPVRQRAALLFGNDAQVRRFLVGRNWLNERHDGRISENARERALMNIAAGASERELKIIVGDLLDQGRLTGALIVRAACAGNMRFVETAIATLCAMPVRKVAHLLRSRGAFGCEAVCARAALGGRVRTILQVAYEAFADITAGPAPAAEGIGSRMIEIVLSPDRGNEGEEGEGQGVVIDALCDYGSGAAQDLARQIRARLKNAA